ncbi:type II membrane protein [Blastocladiella emersonii ATCC 22665]|nr:type II membrane protein [Blastocladiella emersonii ATCC 22665]
MKPSTSNNPMLLLVAAALLAVVPGAALAAFDCSKIDFQGRHFDVSLAFKSDAEISQVVATPPSKTTLTYRANACRALASPSDTSIPAEDRCDAGAWTCLTKRIDKGNVNLVAEVVNLVAGGDAVLPRIEYAASSATDGEGGVLTLAFDGKAAEGRGFATAFRFECNHGSAGAWEIKERTDEKLVLGVRSAAGCPTAAGAPANGGGDKKPDAPPATTPETPSSGGGFGSFVLTIFLLFCGYMLIGTLYRRFALRLEGTDQIPHYEFFAELPGMAIDLFLAIKAKLTGGQRGYIQV